MEILAAVAGKRKLSEGGIRDDMTEQQKQLITENHNLIYSFLNTYNLDVEEYYDLAAIGLCRAAKSYQHTNSRFSTYAYRCMYNIVANELNRKQNVGVIPEHLVISYNNTIKNENDEMAEYLEYIPSDFDLEYSSTSKVFLMTLIENLSLSKRDLLILHLLVEGYTLIEIGRIVNCDRSTVARVRKKIVNKLKGFME